MVLTGTLGYTVDGATDKPLKLNANLPEVVLTINGTGAGVGNLKMTYKLTRNGGAPQTLNMALPPKGADGKFHIFLPVEEAVGTANQYSFTPMNITNPDFSVMYNGTYNFPTLSNLARGSSTAYSALGSTLVAPK